MEAEAAAAVAAADTGEPEIKPGDFSSRPLLFNTVVQRFLAALLEASSYQRFAQCYQRFYRFQPEMTRSIYNQFITQLRASITEEIEEIKQEGNLEELLNSLDKLEKEAKERTGPAWRPSGIPEEDLCSVLVPYYLQQREFLQKTLKDREAENAKLAETVLAGREKIIAMQQQIQKRKEAWQALSKAQKEMVMTVVEPPE
ncbi:polyamine-modulated factor 1 [Rhinatrema bivittatum]|uniref:polyamine-modulated factor 1 n=1 Tax=Rhinatrema bivittatum TaxID=194408 RepID=UPI001126411F|nr:polyamine-modulated factor 1 [Rhinatrema bivittatum]